MIAAKFFSEKPAPQPIILEHHYHHYPAPEPIRPWPWPWVWPTPIYCSTTGASFGNIPALTTTCAAPGVSTREVNASSTVKCANAVATSGVPDFKLGTGWGQAKADYVTEASFDRDRELCTLTIYYAEAADLERVGIQLTKGNCSERSTNACAAAGIPWFLQTAGQPVARLSSFK